MTQSADLVPAFIREATRELSEATKRIAHCLHQLTDDQIWWRPDESQNSIANLILHLCGNVRQWIICGLTGAEDHRDRPAEFSTRNKIPAAELLTNLHQTVDQAKAAIAQVTADDLLRVRRIQGFDETGFGAIFHCIPHFRGHTQEIIYRTRCCLREKYKFYWVPTLGQGGAK